MAKGKLKGRLKVIADIVTSKYDHIWDCCCDHGLLGAELLIQVPPATIHFVDLVPDLITKLDNKLHQFFPELESRYVTHCIDVASLPLRQYSGRHLVIIAGVGGDLMVEFVQAIWRQNPNLEIEFILCPVHHQYALRQTLMRLEFGLIDEVLVEENQRYYEVLFVTNKQSDWQPIHPVGEKMWQLAGSDQPNTWSKKTLTARQNTQRGYLTKTIEHYNRMQLSSNVSVRHIIDAYQAVLTTLEKSC